MTKLNKSKGAPTNDGYEFKIYFGNGNKEKLYAQSWTKLIHQSIEKFGVRGVVKIECSKHPVRST